MATRKAKAPGRPTPISWQLSLEAQSVGGDILPLQPSAWVDVEKYPHVAEIHGIKSGQELRVVMKLPAGPLTWDQDAVLLDAGDGRPPIVLWAYQVIRSIRCATPDCKADVRNIDVGFCDRCIFSARAR